MPGIVNSEFQNVAGYDEENFGSAVAQFGQLLEPQAIADGYTLAAHTAASCQHQ
jgi:hypothetical protein